MEYMRYASDVNTVGGNENTINRNAERW